MMLSWGATLWDGAITARPVDVHEPTAITKEPPVEFDFTRSFTVDGRSYFLGILTGLFLVMLGMTIHGETASFPSYPLVTIAIGVVLALAWLYMHDPVNTGGDTK